MRTVSNGFWCVRVFCLPQHTLEQALLSASQEIEMNADNPAAIQSVIQQRDVLQNGLLSTCRERSRANAVSYRPSLGPREINKLIHSQVQRLQFATEMCIMLVNHVWFGSVGFFGDHSFVFRNWFCCGTKTLLYSDLHFHVQFQRSLFFFLF